MGLPMTVETEPFRELAGVRQYTDEPRRRWFFAPTMDLIVWVDECDRPFKFQICYEVKTAEYALTWESGQGFDHALVDRAKGDASMNRTAILRKDDTFDKEYLLALFQNANSNLPPDIGGLVLEALTLYPSSPAAPGRRPALLRR